jgi:hypothetical protein
MASKSSISIRRNSAIDRCADAIRAIWGEEFNLPRRHRDLTMLGAIQLEALADYLECKAQGVSMEVQIDLDNPPPEITVSVPSTVATAATVSSKPARGNKRK